MIDFFRLLLVSVCLLGTSVVSVASPVEEDKVAEAPAFRDPVTDGAADPCVVFNRQEKVWYMFYTQRRANTESCDVAYCYGNKIGVACSDDNGRSWYYRGTLDLDFENGHNTFWAPDVVYYKGKYHMFVTYIRGVRNHWGGASKMMHYTSVDLWKWKCEGACKLPKEGVIDATLAQLPSGKWRMWFKWDSKSYFADSDDLFKWTGADKPAVSDHPHEGAKAFKFGSHYWLVVDEWAGMGVYRSDDFDHWTRQEGRILDTRSNRRDDGPSGSHGDVVVVGDRAWVFYFTHPGRKRHPDANHDANDNIPYEHRRSSIQVAELEITPEGTLQVKDRNAGVRIYLPNDCK